MAAEHAQRQLTSKSGYAIWQSSSDMGHTKKCKAARTSTLTNYSEVDY